MKRSLQKGRSAIYKSILKNGLSNFQLEILEYCETIKTVILVRENFFIKLLKPKYNLLKIAGSLLGFKHSQKTLAKFRSRRHSEESKAKIRAYKHSEEHREKIRAAALNRKHSDETKKKISERNLGRKFSEEHIIKMSEAATGRKHSESTKVKIRSYKHTDSAKKRIGAETLGRKHSEEIKNKIRMKLRQAVIVTNIETGEKVKHESIKLAALKLGISYDTIRRYIKGQKLYKGIYQIVKEI
jgi:group I intron endonuclease